MVLWQKEAGWPVMLAAGAAYALLPQTASAQASAPTPATDASSPAAAPAPTDDIIVTAQRRSERLQDTPLAITAKTGAELRTEGITDIYSLGSDLANVNISQNHGVARIAIRGIGHNASTPITESNIAFHVDGVYVARPEAQGDVFFDVARIEVVRGPQGTLYGRNATGGAVNVITADPTDKLSGYGQVTFGNYNEILAEGAIGAALAPGVSARIAFQTGNHDGYATQGTGNNIRPLDDLNTRAIRGKLKLEPTSNLTVVLEADYFHKKDADGLMRFVGFDTNGEPARLLALGAVFPSDPRDSTADYPESIRKNNWATSGTISWNLAPEFNVTSITGYRKTRFATTTDFDYTNVTATQQNVGNSTREFSQELRAGGKIGRLTYVAGLYYISTNLDYASTTTRNTYLLGQPVAKLVQGQYQQGTIQTRAYAAFAQIGYDITDKLGIDLGLRYTSERSTKLNELRGEDDTTPYNPAIPNTVVNTNVPFARATFNKTTPKVTLRYKATSNILLYATYAQGFKSGGFTIGTGQTSANPTLPEDLTDWEGGIKTELFDRHLQLNISAFDYVYKNLQITTVNPSGGQLVLNAGRSRIRGIEFEAVARPVDGLRLNLDVGLNDSRYLVFSASDPTRPALGIINVAGNRLLQAPVYQINTGIEYAIPLGSGTITPRAEAHFVDRTWFNQFNILPYSQAPYQLYDANLTWRKGEFTVEAFVRNIGNREVLAYASAPATGVPGIVQGDFLPPRTYGVRLGFNF